MNKTAILVPLIAILLYQYIPVSWSQSGLYWGIPSSLPTSLNDFVDFTSFIFNVQRSITHYREDNSNRNVFDFIIVGAGPAGSALSYRLSENKHWDILILEAGGEEVPIMTIPFFLGQFNSKDVNWHYTTTPQDTVCISLEGSKCDYPQGRCIGGGTTINYMFNIRGNWRDFDNWAAMGNKGWSFAEVLPYFKKAEDVRIPELQQKRYRGYDGRIKTTYPRSFSDMGKLLLRAAREAGFLTPEDYNNGPQIGFSRIQTTTFRGERYSANQGYMRETRNRPNVYLRPRSYVTELLMDGTRVKGVRYVRENHYHVAYATKEVILSAGAVNTPALLMRSGIGPTQHLKDLGIPLVKNLPVGYNLMDHAGPIIFVSLNKTVTPSLKNILLNPQTHFEYFEQEKGPLTRTGASEVVSFLDLEGTRFYSPGWPQVEIVYNSINPFANENFAKAYRFKNDRLTQSIYPDMPKFVATMWRLRSKSRGRVYLKDSNPFTAPQIDPNSFEEQEDIEVVLAGVRELQRLLRTPSFQRIGARILHVPVSGCEFIPFDTNDYWRCAITRFSLTIYHPTGTCKMAPAGDPTGVVTPDLRVVGIEKLRVIDSSICPVIPTGHLQMTAYMIGEKMSDVLKREYEF